MSVTKFIFPGLIFLLCLLTFDVSGQVISGTPIEIDYANPKEYEIGGITISGVKFLDNSALVMLSGLSVGDRIKVPGEELARAIENLWKQGLFENVKITATKVQDNLIFLNIDLSERPRMSTFSFEGIKKSEADNIRDEIKLASGDVVTENLLIRTTNKIKKNYTDKGYLDADIKIKQIEDTLRRNHVRLLISIDKKERVKINHINITGNEHFDEERIKRFLKKTKEKGTFNPLGNLEMFLFQFVKDIVTLQFDDLKKNASAHISENMKLRIFKSSKFIPDDYKADLIAVIEKFNELGYRDASIVSDSVYRNPDNSVGIDITVFEGSRYYFRNISWVGNTKYSDEYLTRILRVEKGDVYNWKLLNANLSFNMNEDDVSSLYMNDGYLFFQANPVEVSVENDSIDLEIRVYEGKQATVKRVSVSGNSRTSDHVIVRELRTRPGQLFSRSDLIRTTRELAQLRYFNAETINPQVDPNPAESTVDINYEVEETSSDQIELSGGWGYGRVIGTLGVSFNNFSLGKIFDGKAWRPVPTGDGQKLSLRLQSYGKGYISYSASFTEPWMGGKKPHAFSVSYYHSLFSNGLLKDDPDRRSFVMDGITVGLGRKLTWPDDYFQLYMATNFQRYNLQNYTNVFSFGTGTGYYNNINFNITLSRNSIDFPIYPRSGSLVSLGLFITPPYSLASNKDYAALSENEKYKMIEFHKWAFQFTFFTPVVENLVIMTRARYGFLGNYNPALGNTPFERYYLGGDGLSGYNNLDGREIIGMRGYGNETLTPDYYKSRNTGGSIVSKLTLELRYPLSLNPSATIFVASFLEAGNAWPNFQDFNPVNLYKAAGFGVRVFLPMFGILGLDWGYGFDNVPGLPDANRGQFHFSINQSID
jgi:outer membrane protein insertion porin family